MFVCSKTIGGGGEKKKRGCVQSHECKLIHGVYFLSCECYWSFRRFTYGNLVTTSPSSKCSDLSDFELPIPKAEPSSQALSENFIGTFIGRSDGRCVQRAGTYSMRVDDSRLQGIPRCMTNNCNSQSLARREFKRLAKILSDQLICSLHASV